VTGKASMPAARGRPPMLTLEQVLAAAIQCADSDGLDGCTMRAVADRLGVTPMALYRHVRDKDELLARIPDLLVRDVMKATTRRTSGALALREIALGLAGVLKAHPWATRLFEQPEPGPNMQAAAEHCIGLLVADGASGEEAYRWIRAVVAQVIGEMLTKHEQFDGAGVDLLLTAIAHASRARECAE
jgi:AcrR family transcriptional regulator